MAGKVSISDYIKYGSPEHAAFLGLIIADKDDKEAIEGYRLADTTVWGAQATSNFLKEVLRQKVAELKSGKPKVPPGSPSLFVPREAPGLQNVPTPVPD